MHGYFSVIDPDGSIFYIPFVNFDCIPIGQEVRIIDDKHGLNLVGLMVGSYTQSSVSGTKVTLALKDPRSSWVDAGIVMLRDMSHAFGKRKGIRMYPVVIDFSNLSWNNLEMIAQLIESEN